MKYNFGCLMVDIDLPFWNELQSTIDDDDIYIKKDQKSGRELETHCTILYGLHDNVNKNDLVNVIKNNFNSPISLKLKKINIFENPEYDVLKFEIESEQLVKYNKIICDNFDYTSNFDYNPHITIAYLKKGTGKKYITDIKSMEVGSNILKYSDINNKTYTFILKSKNKLDEKFVSKKQANYFYWKSKHSGPANKKWKKMTKEFSKDTDWKNLPKEK